MTRSNKGFALMAVLAMVMMVLILANVFSLFVSHKMQLYERETKSIKAYFAAISGVVFARSQIDYNSTNARWNFPASVPRFEINENEYVTLAFTQDPANRCILHMEAVGNVEGVQRTVSLTFEGIPGYAVGDGEFITKWGRS